MKKRFFIPACVLVVVAIGFVIYVAGHPELSFPWSIQITHILYGLYVDAVMMLFVLAFWEKATFLNTLTLLFALGAIFFLVQSILAVFSEGKPGWYLPLALGLNCVALFLNAAQRKNKRERTSQKNEKEEKNCNRMQHRCRNLLRNRQLRSFLPWSDGAWLDICYSDGGTVGTCGDECPLVEKNR